MAHIEHALGYPSVTTILRDYNNGWLKFFYKKHGTYDRAEMVGAMGRDRGTRIHKAFEMLMQNVPVELALEKVNPEENKIVLALDQWIIDHKVEPTHVETEVESVTYKYHGSLDLCAFVHDLNIKTDYCRNYVELPNPVHVILDLKTQDGRTPTIDEAKKHSMQMAAYGLAMQEQLEIEINYGLILNADVATGIVTPVVIHPLQAYQEPFLLQRKLYDYIKSEDKWEHLRLRKKAV